MKITLVSTAALLILLLGTTMVPAQTGANARVESRLMKLERDIGDANLRRDKKFFERVEAEEFVFTDSMGGLTTKSEDIASLDKPVGEARLVNFAVDDMKVAVYGKTAVVIGRAVWTYKRGDREIINKTRFTDVFVKRDGQWRIVAGHSSRMP